MNGSLWEVSLPQHRTPHQEPAKWVVLNLFWPYILQVLDEWVESFNQDDKREPAREIFTSSISNSYMSTSIQCQGLHTISCMHQYLIRLSYEDGHDIWGMTLKIRPSLSQLGLSKWCVKSWFLGPRVLNALISYFTFYYLGKVVGGCSCGHFALLLEIPKPFFRISKHLKINNIIHPIEYNYKHGYL